MKIITTILLFLSFPLIGFSQLNTFSLSSFSQPDYYRKFSQITPNAFFTTSHRKDDFEDGNREIERGLNMTYSTSIEKYNRSVQSEFIYSENTTVNYERSESFKNYLIYQSQSLSYDGRFFFSPNDYFSGIEVDHFGYLFYRREDVKEDGQFIEDNKSFDVNTTNRLVIKVGKGRIENINVAWHAMRILEVICENSALEQSNITHEQIEAFANKLGEIQNIRLTDPRLEFNKEVEVIFEYLKSADLIVNEDYFLFAQVLDAYRFESFINRRKGSNFSIGLGFRYNNLIQHQNDIDEDPLELDDYENINIDSRIGPFITMQLNYYRPLHYKWQLDFENYFDYGKENIKDYSDNTNTPNGPNDSRGEDITGLMINTIGLNYLLSRRTNILFSYSSVTSYIEDLIETENIFARHTNRLGMDMEYYFSPWNILSVDLGYEYSKGYKNSNLSSTDTSIRISNIYYFH